MKLTFVACGFVRADQTPCPFYGEVHVYEDNRNRFWRCPMCGCRRAG